MFPKLIQPLLRPVFDRGSKHLTPRVRTAALGAVLSILLPVMAAKALIRMFRGTPTPAKSTEQGWGDGVGIGIGVGVLVVEAFTLLALLPWLGLMAIPVSVGLVVFAGGALGYSFPQRETD